jgi:hypothetical protein
VLGAGGWSWGLSRRPVSVGPSPHEVPPASTAVRVDEVQTTVKRSAGSAARRQLTVTAAEPPSTGSMPSAMRMASSISVSTILDSGTVLTTSPLTKI